MFNSFFCQIRPSMSMGVLSMLILMGCGDANDASQQPWQDISSEGQAVIHFPANLKTNAQPSKQADPAAVTYDSAEQGGIQDGIQGGVVLNGPTATTPTIAEQDSRASNGMREQLLVSHARVASNYPHICPKLLQPQVDSVRIERTQEVMVGNYCDYYLYPNRGQSIEVITKDSRLESLLVVPTVHNFANGAYQVSSYDRHVVRLKYDAITSQPQGYTYDVEVIVR